MGLLNYFGFRPDTPHAAPGAPKRKVTRHARVEQLEKRELLAADGIAPEVLLGGVYFEEATGDDSEADVLQVSFVGGPAGTTLDKIVISGDKFGDGLTGGDLFFDTVDGGLGWFDSVGYSLIASDGFTITGVSVVDGGTDIEFTFDGFDAGEKLVFSVDVDEAQAVNPNTGEVLQNSLVEGAEFELSTIVGHFSADGYVDLTLNGTYYDAFDGRRADAETATGLALDLPNDRYEVDDDKSDRTAGAVVHAAMTPLASISGYVYHDRSDDGVYDRGDENPISGVQIELLDASGQGTGVFTTTDSQGYYEFRNLTAGTYGVREVNQPAPYYDGKDTAGSHGGAAGNEIILGATLDFGDDAVEYNFGELLGGSIAGRVHASTGPECDFENPEILLSGVQIDLLDAGGNFIRSITTDANGFYKFENLRPGEYQVREHQPADYYDGGEHVGTAGGVASDDLITGIVIGSEVHATRYDFCEHVGATLSGYVYHDKSDDGQFDSDEDPISGVTVQLLNAEGTPLGTTQTDQNGYYEFTDLPPGDYTVVELQPVGWYDGKDTAGTTGGVAGDDVLSTIPLNFGDHSQQNNFGELLAGSIAGRVGASTGPDCNFDDPEIPLQGVQIDLLDADGNFIRSTTTDANGFYKFNNLAPGEYQVREHQPAGYFDGGERVGTAGGNLFDDLVTGIAIGSDQHATQYDFCEHVGAMLSGNVYHDANDDGQFDPSEDGIAGVEVKLLDADGVYLRSEFTNAAGFYKFNDLAPGKYTVMEVHPANWVDGKDTVGSHGGDVTNDMIAGAMLTFGDSAVNYNFGELLAATIAGRVHASTGPECDFDNPEILLEGVQIDLLDASGNFITSTTTDADGFYKFVGLRPGEYQVQEHQPADYFDGGERVGSAGGNASDDLITGIQLDSGENAVQYDFCEHVGASLSGFVYHDRSDDGVYDTPSEEPISGVELKLLKDGVDTGRRAVTNASGYYQFTDLAPGSYTVMEIHPDGWIDGKDTAGSLGGVVDNPGDMIRSIVLNFGDDSVENNFGELLPGSIRGSVHVSTDPECDPHDGEPPIEGVEIQLLNEAGEVIATTYTDANGEYEFTGLPPAVYSVREIQPEGYFNGDQHVGTGSGSYFGQDFIGDIVVGSDQHWIHYDFCETPPASLSGYVFIDGPPIVSLEDIAPEDVANYRDGARTADDTPLAGVVVELRNGFSGDPIFGVEALPGYYPDGPIRTTTDANGYYRFDGLPGGNYAVVQIQPEDLIDGIDTVGTLGGDVINARPPLDGKVIQFEEGLSIGQWSLEQFRTTFGTNAIVRIPLQAGQHSAENNFSEVQTTPFLPPPVDPPVETPPPVFAQPPILVTSILPVAFINQPTPAPPAYRGSALGWTWHLSVVNAGRPRAAIATGPSMLLAKSQFDAASWDQASLDQAEWVLLQDEVDKGRLERFAFGSKEGIPVTGDWDGDGVTEIGVFVEGYWYLDLNGSGYWDRGDLWAKLGTRDDLPVTGDWDGDGKTDIGIYGPAWPRDPYAIQHEPGLPDADNYPGPIAGKAKNVPPVPEEATSGGRLLRRTAAGQSRADLIDHVFHYGTPGDAPIAGDWNGDGIRTIGVYRDGVWTLDTNGDGRVGEDDQTALFGQAGDIPVVGDWNGDGIDDLGVFRAGRWLVDSNNNRELDAKDSAFELGESGDTPIAGDWDGDGADEPAVYGPKETEVRVSRRAG